MQTLHETGNAIDTMIRGSSMLCERFQGLVSQQFYVEILDVDNKTTATVHDTCTSATFDANFDVDISGGEKPQRNLVFAGIYDDGAQALAAVMAYAISAKLYE